ncbi:MAG: bifunctional 2-polyprenyl-6-hydroxyphenol methylase/3-demethylubiquinol 3-O-methyltransferase UbiG [Hyphomicrobiaceae bacterium]
MTAHSSATLDTAEVDRFNALASEWWDPTGKFRPLHKLGPARLGFIRDACFSHFPDLNQQNRKPLAGLTLLDVGCGGGLIAEPLARLGATVTAIDPAAQTIAAAQHHADQQHLNVNYRATQVESLVEADEMFDVVTCLEVVEHVPDVEAFLRACTSLVSPGGLFVGATINRTLKSYALAIVAAEYILGWLPRGTHRWDRFIQPKEFSAHLKRQELQVAKIEGIVHNPLADSWSRSSDTDVNYMIAAAKPPSPPIQADNQAHAPS